MVAPGKDAQDFDGLVGTLKSGIAVKSWGQDPGLDVDFQCLNGLLAEGACYQVKEGRIVAKIEGAAGLLFRAPDLWKGLVALGGAASAQRYGVSMSKGEPEQDSYHSVTAPPAVFQQLILIDAARKT